MTIYYWDSVELDVPALETARQALVWPADSAFAYPEAFRVLLRSGLTVPMSIALACYASEESTSRWGFDNPFGPYAREVREAAREVLRRPPLTAARSGAGVDGADHASALNALLNLAEPADTDLIAEALALAHGSDVRTAACQAACTALGGGAPASPRLVTALGELAFDRELDARDRTPALRALYDAQGPAATELLLRATGCDETELQVEAALGLVHRDFHTYRKRLARLVATWPKDAKYPADEVREAVEGFHSYYWAGAEPDGPGLARAHEELMFPTGEAATHRAFRTLLDSADPAAVGIALDHFTSDRGLRKSLDEDDVAAYGSDVLARARELLRLPPSPLELSPVASAAAGHMSALNAIARHPARTSDAELIADVLERTAVTEVRSKGLWAAYGVLTEMGTPDRRLVEAVGRFVFDPSVAGHEKAALRVLSQSAGPAANPYLVLAVRGEDPGIQVCAAAELARPERLEEYRTLLEDLVESWPPLAPSGRLRLLRRMVERTVLGGIHSVHWEGSRLGDPELYRAHRELRAPTGEESYHRALRLLLDSGQTVAVGIALDHWSQEKGIEAHFGAAARTTHTPRILARARELLRLPPSPPELSPVTGPGASHLSALAALRVADAPAPEDRALLAAVVSRTWIESVRQSALRTADCQRWGGATGHATTHSSGAEGP